MGLDLVDTGQVVEPAGDAVLGELTFAEGDLATTAEPAAATDRIDIDPQAARRRQDRRTEGETAAAA